MTTTRHEHTAAAAQSATAAQVSPIEPNLAGRRALVTGSASGIGLAIARRLAACGAQVVANDVSSTALETLRDEPWYGEHREADLSDRDSLRALTASAGDIDILVNNAGLQHVSPAEDFADERWDTLLAVMLTAPFMLSKAVLPGMYERGWGRVINIVSVHGLAASPYKSAYVSAKHGLIGLTRTLALEAAARCPDVTLHAICPSYVRTPLVENQITAQAAAHGLPVDEVLADVILSSNAVKRLIEPSQVAEMAAYLCGPSAWAMTGAPIPMDAGWLAH
jgi:3-hydroxybutyrate dehydrogenase